ncbi:hypothetical protein QF025_006934 [Paraburkholderia graminis]|uniref:Uncharacterized protein n=1 Tax=Paraburkholderia graminis TaxID=60548 RepID=A0ABD5CS21_9BURK|nr:hypothetical protein [Paraburkholderia graminis]
MVKSIFCRLPVALAGAANPDVRTRPVVYEGSFDRADVGIVRVKVAAGQSAGRTARVAGG